VFRILAADIGGTHSRMGFFELAPGGAPQGADEPRLLDVTRLRTQESASFSALLSRLFSTPQPFAPADCDLAVLAVAGPVEGNVCTPPNIKWSVDLRDIAAAGLSRGALINDFAAQAYACRSAAVRDARVLQPGQAGHHAPGGTLAVIGAGTGLGHCALVSDGAGGHIAVPSEAGHAPFAFVNDEEFAFGEQVRRSARLDYCVGDTIVTGSGLSRLHAYLTDETLTPAEVAGRLPQSPHTVEWFARFYGRAARSYALAVMALGGVYLAGGVAAKNPVLVEHPAFLEEFRRSATHGSMLAGLPVLLNANQDSGVHGAALYGAQLLRRQG
jgi:glucokinase